MHAPGPERNAELLAAYGRNPSTANRNAVVHANLPLVWRLARRKVAAAATTSTTWCRWAASG